VVDALRQKVEAEGGNTPAPEAAAADEATTDVAEGGDES
jgi:large subunit ribosomal protein L10